MKLNKTNIAIAKLTKNFGSLKTSSIIAFIYHIANVGLMFIFHILLARILGANEYGTYVFAISVSVFLTIPAKLGFQTSVLRFIPEYISQKKWSSLYGLLRGSWFLSFIAGLIISILSSFIIILFLDVSKYLPLFVAIWLIPFTVILNLQSSMAKAIRKMNTIFLPGILQPILISLLAFLVILKNYKLTSEIILFLTMGVLFVLVSIQLSYIITHYKKIFLFAKPEYKLNYWLKVSIPLLLISSFQVILNRTDVVMIGFFFESQNVGLYNVASRTSSLVSFVLIAVNAVAIPIYSSLFVKNDLIELQKFVTKVAKGIFWPSLIISIMLLILSNFILSLFGAEFVSAKVALIILLLGHIINAIAGPVGSILNMTGYQNQSMKVYGISAISNIILNLILIPLYGIIGAAIATTITTILWNIWLYYLVVKHLNIIPSFIRVKFN